MKSRNPQENGETIVQIHQNFVWGTPEEFKAEFLKQMKKTKNNEPEGK